MRHQDFSAALKEALAEAKRKFNAEQQNEPDTETTTTSFAVYKTGVRVSYKRTEGRTRKPITNSQGVEIGAVISGGYYALCNTTYTWEELMP